MRIDPTAPTRETQQTAAATNTPAPPNGESIRLANNALPALELGAELNATVVDELAGGRLLLKAGDSLFEADGPGGISPGQQLTLSVKQLLPQVVLQITGTAPTLEAEAARLLRQLPALADAGGLLEHLQTLLKGRLETQGEGSEDMAPARKLVETIGLMLADRGAVTAEKVQTLLQNGGLYYEAKLADAVLNGRHALGDIVDGDLKGLLLSALEQSKSATFGAEIVQTIRAQLNNVEAQQAGNLLAQLNNGGLQLQIPFFNGTNFTTAALLVEPDEKHADDKENPQGGYKLLFLLDLENFGRTRIDAHITEHRAMVIFYVDRDSSVALTNEALPGFHELLVGMGYREVLLAARPLKEIPEDKQQKFDALAAGRPASIRLLDLKV